MTPAPAPLARTRRRAFPVRQPRADRLSLPGLLHAVHSHPELPEDERENVQRIRAKVARRSVVIDVELVSEPALLGSGA